MNILLDLDGVLSDFFTEALNRLNKAFGKSLSKDEYISFNTFNMDKVFGTSQETFWHTLEQHDDFWCNLKPFPWARELLDVLSSKGEVTICTSPSHHPICAKQKIEWCQDYLDLNSSSLMIGGRKYLMARPDCVLIDDYPKNRDRFLEAGGSAYLVPSNWNTKDLTLDKVKAAVSFL